jgi:hypothetical protein
MMEAIRSSEISVLTRATWRNIPEDGIVHSHRREDLKSYNEIEVLFREEIAPADVSEPKKRSNIGVCMASRDMHDCATLTGSNWITL